MAQHDHGVNNGGNNVQSADGVTPQSKPVRQGNGNSGNYGNSGATITHTVEVRTVVLTPVLTLLFNMWTLFYVHIVVLDL